MRATMLVGGLVAGLMVAGAAAGAPLVEVDMGGDAEAQVLAVSGVGQATCTGLHPAAPACAAVALAGTAQGPVAATGIGPAAACQDHLYLTLHPCVAVAAWGPASGWIAASGVGDSQGFAAASGTGEAQGRYAVGGCRAEGVVVSVGLGVCFG